MQLIENRSRKKTEAGKGGLQSSDFFGMEIKIFILKFCMGMGQEGPFWGQIRGFRVGVGKL